MDHCSFVNNNSSGIYFTNSENLQVDHNRFDNSNGGVQGTSVKGLIVTANTFQSNVKCDDQIGVFGESSPS